MGSLFFCLSHLPSQSIAHQLSSVGKQSVGAFDLAQCYLNNNKTSDVEWEGCS